VLYKITPHAGYGAPHDAIERLSQRLGAGRDRVSFAKAGAELRATWDEHRDTSTTPEEHREVGRRAVLDAVREVCEVTPDLKLDWYAVSPVRDDSRRSWG
jgi:hypothetical protein